MKSIFFKHNRHALLERLGSGALVVMTAHGDMQQAHDMEAPFLQESHFWYLTGINKPNWWLIIDGSDKTYAVAPELDDIDRAFNGELSMDDVKNASGVDRVISRIEAEDILKSLARKHSLVYTVDHADYIRKYLKLHLNPALKDMKSLLERTFSTVEDCSKDLWTLRTLKQPEEIEAMRRAARITCEAFEVMKKEMASYTYEYEAEARLTYEIRRRGADGHAYAPIAASGGNACTLHYVSNNSQIQKRQFLLFDVGARFDNYAADISRTYAIGQVSKRAQAVHLAVQKAQLDMIEAMQPGVALKEFREQSENFMKQALTSLKLDPEKLYSYMPHAVSHGLGIDPHDMTVGYEALQPGMVLTAELGMYLPEEGIGVRIEDDVLITVKGHENFSGTLDTNF